MEITHIDLSEPQYIALIRHDRGLLGKYSSLVIKILFSGSVSQLNLQIPLYNQ